MKDFKSFKEAAKWYSSADDIDKDPEKNRIVTTMLVVYMTTGTATFIPAINKIRDIFLIFAFNIKLIAYTMVTAWNNITIGDKINIGEKSRTPPVEFK